MGGYYRTENRHQTASITGADARAIVRLGRFKSLEKATSVITQARVKAHGEFARTT